MMEKKETEREARPITALPGVGPVRARAYEKLGIRTTRDLVYHFPRAYENRGEVRLLCSVPDGERTGERAAVILTVGSEPKISMIRRGMSLLKFRAFDDSGIAEITYFNQNYLKDTFTVGSEFRFYGKIVRPTTPKGRYTLSSPAFEPYAEGEELPPFYPVYPLTEGLSGKTVGRDVKNALAEILPTARDILPEEIRLRNRLCTLPYALRNIQMPSDYAALAAAKRRLIFDEFFLFSLGAAMNTVRERQVGAPICMDAPMERFLRLLPYTLTGAQKRVIDEIRADMRSEYPMNRILVGDVGSGKTVCAAAAIFAALSSGKQAALMAPTEILARQHYAELSGWFSALGFRTALLVGATTAAEKRAIYNGLSTADRGERIDLVVGTHALLSEGVEFADPALVVADEQHRFGVIQRATLAEKNRNAHLLVMSATPIPRSLALVMYGDLALSVLDEMPAGRQRVETFAVDEGYRARLNRFIRKQVELGGQVYVVCPAIEEMKQDEEGDLLLSEVLEGGEAERFRLPPLKNAVDFTEELRAALPDIPIAMMHGKMKSKEKDAVMGAFARGEVKVLCSTTVIEVGVNVPAATLMIIENAERFGLSQLHQLRGRVGRGRRQSYCVLVSDAMRSMGEGEESPARLKVRERLKVLCSTSDGFTIAEKDLETRGPGDFLRHSGSGEIRQSGGLRFRIADLCSDAELFHAAAEEAKGIAVADPMLEGHPALKTEVARLFTVESGTMN